VAKIGVVSDQSGQKPLEQPTNLDYFINAGIGFNHATLGIRLSAGSI
jgi:hypothetical protein